MKSIELEKLPPLDIIKQLSHEQIVAEIVIDAGLENASPADPAYRVALAAGYREVLLRKDANEQAQGVFLAFARGPQLDHIAATYYRHPDGSGLERLAEENDESFQKRVQQSPEGLSVAGPNGAYEFHAMSADSRVKGVSLLSPSPVSVELYVLSKEGSGLASNDLLSAVEAYLIPLRPLTDEVIVLSATVDTYSVSAVLTMKQGPDSEIARQAAVDRLSAYVEKNRQLNGRVVESGIHAALTVEGVEEVTLIDWLDKTGTSKIAPYCESIQVTIGGYI